MMLMPDSRGKCKKKPRKSTKSWTSTSFSFAYFI